MVALGNTTGTITAGRDSMIASLGSVLATVNAAGNSFAWAYGDLIGTYHATSGFAGGVSLGDSNHTLLAGTDAFAVAGGRLNTLMQAGDYAYVWSGGDLSGAIVAGASATAISFGKAGLALTAGRDAVGDVDGMYSAARDLAIASYGRISILGQAGRDVPWLWARGDVEGTYLVGRHVGEVFSYGNVFFALMAGQSVSGTGSVGSVQAWGSLGGLVTAADSIDYLRVGDQVTAILSAASVAVPIEYDTTIFLDYPYPAAPESPMPGVLAAAAVQLGEIQAAKGARLVEIAAARDAHQAERATVAGKLAEEKSEVYSQGQQELAERQEAKEEGIDALKKDLARLQAEAKQDDAEVRRLAEVGLQVAQGEKAADERAGQEKYDKARAETAQADSDAAADQAEMAQSRKEELARFDTKREEALDWPEQYRAAVKDWLWQKVQERANKLLDPGAMALELAGFGDDEVATAKLGWKQAMENGDGYASAIYQVVGVWGFNKIPGVMFLYQSITGEDPVTLEKYNAGDRWLKAIIGGVQLGAAIVGAAGGLAALRAPCGGAVWNRIFGGPTCFTAGHWILVLDSGYQAAIAGVDEVKIAKSEEALGIWQGAVVGGAALIVVVRVTLQEIDYRRRKKQAEELLDACFGEWDDEDNEMDKTMLPPNDNDSGSIASLWETDPHGECWADNGGLREGCVDSVVATLAPAATAVLPATKLVRAHQTKTTIVAARASGRPNFSRTKPGRNWGWLAGLGILPLLLVVLLLAWSRWFGVPTVPDPSQSTSVAASITEEPRWTEKRIEDIQPDDVVLAFNIETGEPEPRRVVQVFQRLSFDLRLLDFQNAAGEVQRFKTTEEHPFWVPAHRDYVDAEDLQVGDEVESPEGERQKLVRTERELHPEGVLVYNFEVEGLHNYFVLAPDRTGPSVLVHNANGYASSVGNLSKLLRNKMKRIGNEIAAGGNRGISGSVTSADAMKLGEKFVGPRFRVMSGNQGLISDDGLRQFRFPAAKRGINPATGESWSKTGVQVNFQSRLEAAGEWINNVHLDVL